MEQITKKRKRKHPKSSVAQELAVGAKSRKDEKVERKKKKARKQKEDSSEPEIEEDVEEKVAASADGVSSGEEDKEEEHVEQEMNGQDGQEEEEEEKEKPKHPDADINSNQEGDIINDLPLDATLHLPSTGENPEKFSDLNLSAGTRKALEKMGFETMTEVQARTIPPLMAGRDVHFSSFI
jgi:ATP-dependent RNA helicase DDX18/HAS1